MILITEYWEKYNLNTSILGDSRRSEVLFEHNIHASGHLGEQEVVACFVQRALLALIPSLFLRKSEALRGRASGCGASKRRC